MEKYLSLFFLNKIKSGFEFPCVGLARHPTAAFNGELVPCLYAGYLENRLVGSDTLDPKQHKST